MAKKDVNLGDAELEVLKVLWDHGPMTVREVLGVLEGLGRDWAYTTVLTMMTRLEAKGVVSANKDGPAYVYRPKVSRDRVVKDRVQGLVEQLFGGTASPLVLALMQSERFSPKELAEFRALIDRLDAGVGRGTGEGAADRRGQEGGAA